MNNRTAGAEVAGGATSAGQDEWVSKSQVQEFRERIKQLQKGGWTVDTIATRIGYQHGRSLWKALAKGRVRRRIFDALTTLPAKSSGAAAAKPAAKTAPTSKATTSVSKTAPVSKATVSVSKTAPASKKAASPSKAGAVSKATPLVLSAAGPASKSIPASKGASVPKKTPAPKTASPSRSSPPKKATASSAAGGKVAGGSLRGATAHLDLARRYLEIARGEVQRASTASRLLEPGLRDVMGEIDALSDRLSL